MDKKWSRKGLQNKPIRNKRIMVTKQEVEGEEDVYSIFTKYLNPETKEIEKQEIHLLHNTLMIVLDMYMELNNCTRVNITNVGGEFDFKGYK
jgi:hypothetical protein